MTMTAMMTMTTTTSWTKAGARQPNSHTGHWPSDRPGRGRRGSVSSQLENLIRRRHFDASVGKMCRELPHDVFFAVNKERAFCAGLLLPSQQLRLVGMAGETITVIV
jgi:hypothetical protein